MRRILIISILSLAGFSCEDFLDREPLGTAIDENFNDDFNELQVSLNAVYNTLSRANYQRTMWLIGEGCGDDVVNTALTNPANDDVQLNTFTFDTRNIWLELHWSENYLGIFRANRVVAGIKENLEEILSGTNQEDDLEALQQIAGQARFLRALFYFNLVRTYGGVPIKDEILLVDGNKDNFQNPRATVDEVYDYIEKDLREAICVLPPTYASAGVEIGLEIGKARLGAAVGLLIKVLAYRAVPNSGDDRWTEIVQLSNFLINGSPSSIRKEEILDFSGLYDADPQKLTELRRGLSSHIFGTSTGFEPLSDQEFLNQIVDAPTVHDLDVSYDMIWTKAGETRVGDIGNGLLFEINHFTPSNQGGNAAVDPTQITTNVFDELATSSGANLFIQPSEIVVNRLKGIDDRRISWNVISHAEQLPDGSTSSAAILPSNNAVVKWYTRNEERPSVGRNLPVLRLGEVYTLYAEALNETGNQALAAEVLNTLRERPVAALPEPSLLIQPSNYFDMREIIFRQKRYEMMFEFDRFYEIIRQGNFRREMIEYNEEATPLPQHIKQYENLIGEVFPIPQNEVDLSNGLVVQNPGY